MEKQSKKLLTDSDSIKNTEHCPTSNSPLNIVVAGTGYVGLSIAVLLAQHNHVTAVDIIPEKVDMINNRKSPIQDEYIEKYFEEKDLNLTATTDGALATKMLTLLSSLHQPIMTVRKTSLIHLLSNL